MKADDVIHLRIPAEQKARWMAEAQARNLKLSALIVHAVESLRAADQAGGEAVLAELGREVAELVHEKVPNRSNGRRRR